MPCLFTSHISSIKKQQFVGLAIYSRSKLGFQPKG